MATKKRKTSTGPKCECGGILKPAVLSNFEFTRYSGLPSFLDGVPGWKCGTCNRELLHGAVINASLFLLAMEIVELPHRLTSDFTKYLRRSMQITQQELADRMGVVRETVANWESGLKEISPQHDLILRALMINHALGSQALPSSTIVGIAREAMVTLSAVKSGPPPRPATDVRVPASAFAKLPPKMATVYAS